MADQQYYFKDPPRLVYELMRATFGENQFTYFLESPDMIAEAAYPALVVESAKSQNTITNAPTGTDNVSEQINIYVIINMKEAFGASDDEDTAKRQLYQLIQGRDPQTGAYLANTVVGALRTNISLYNGQTNLPTTIDQDIDIDYIPIARPNQPTLLSAVVSIVTRERVVIGTRK